MGVHMAEKLSVPRRFRGIRKQVSAFLLTALVGFAGLVLLVAWKQGAFVQHTNIYFHAPDATGMSKGMADMLDEVRQQLTPAFQELRKAAAEMANPRSDFRRSMSALRELIEELPPATRELRQLARDADRTIVSLGRQAEATLANVDHNLPLLAGKIANTLDTLDATAKQVQETTRSNGDAL